MTPERLALIAERLREFSPELDEAAVQRMLRAVEPETEARMLEAEHAEGERAGRSYWMTGVTQVLDPSDRLRLTEDELFSALEDLARPTERRVAALRYATRLRR